MFYYQYKGLRLCAFEGDLPFSKAADCGEGEVIFLFRRAPLAGRDSFRVTDAGLFTVEEGPESLTVTAPAEVDAELARAVAEGRVTLTVEDDGDGIPADRLSSVFSGSAPRMSTGRSDDRRSMGIGLSVCRSIIRAHGGDMCAARSARGGAAISFDLHCTEADDV